MDFNTWELKHFLDLLLEKLKKLDFTIGIIQKIRTLETINNSKTESNLVLGVGGEPRKILRLSNILERSRDESILNYQDFHILQQLCSMDSDIFKNITPRDYITPESSDSISRNIEFFNRLSNWTITQILKEFKPKNRAKVICKFMNICIVRFLYNLSVASTESQ